MTLQKGKSQIIFLLFTFLLSLTLVLFFLFGGQNVKAGVDEELREIEQQITDLSKQLELSQEATAPLESELVTLEQRIASLKNKLAQISFVIGKKGKEIAQEEKNLSYQKEVFARAVREFYKKSQADLPLITLLGGDFASTSLRGIFFQTQIAKKDREIILEIAQRIQKLNEDKTKLESEKKSLASLQTKLDERAGFLRKEVTGAKAFQTSLESKIAGLTQRQQELLAQKTGTFQTSVGEVPPADDPASRPDYNPGFSPAFASFSFGAPHRKGMSQYGAYGRAQAGQDEETILKAYYGNIRIEQKDMPEQINTDQGTKDFESNYLMGIAEMPSSWSMTALKAQAIAARTYALSTVSWRVGNPQASGSICTSESCQVYSSSKAQNPPESWKKAVQDSKGKIMVSSSTSDIFSAFYASTSGGYTFSYSSLGHSTSGGWDTTCGSQSCWTSEAYEKKAGSPWFYKAWYKTRSGFTCGGSHPWLNMEEFVDILNAVLVYFHDSGSISHLSQVDANTCWNKDIPETWSQDQLREEAKKYGGPISSVSSISVSYSGGGSTANVTFSTDKGSFTFSGEDFKTIFNLRAPRVNFLQSSLFNLEKK